MHPDDKVVVVRPRSQVVFRYWIPWSMIHWVQQSDVVVIHLRDGKKIKPVVGDWSLAGRVRGNRRQVKLQELIGQARSIVGDGPAADVEIRRTLRVHAIPAVAIFAVFVLFSYLVRG